MYGYLRICNRIAFHVYHMIYLGHFLSDIKVHILTVSLGHRFYISYFRMSLIPTS